LETQPLQEQPRRETRRAQRDRASRGVDAGGWVSLQVLESRVTEEADGRRITDVLRKGQDIRRKRHSIERGGPERLRWSDEGARAGRFFADTK
jgi:hypothetical protein